MIPVERSFHNPRVFSISDEFIVIVGWGNPNDGAGTHADKGTIFIQKTCAADTSYFWLKFSSSDPKSWVTWGGEGQPRYQKSFGFDGVASTGKYLESFHSIPTNKTPFTAPEDGVIRAISVTCSISTTVSFELLKNGGVIDTITITAGTYATKKGLNYLYVTNDQFAVRVSSGSAKNVGYSGFFQVAMVP